METVGSTSGSYRTLDFDTIPCLVRKLIPDVCSGRSSSCRFGSNLKKVSLADRVGATLSLFNWYTGRAEGKGMVERARKDPCTTAVTSQV